MDTSSTDSPSPETKLPFPEDKGPIEHPVLTPPVPTPPAAPVAPTGKQSRPRAPRRPKAAEEDDEDDEMPCPAKSPELGDMTPEYVLWQIRNDPKRAQVLYADRLERLPEYVRETLAFALQEQA